MRPDGRRGRVSEMEAPVIKHNGYGRGVAPGGYDISDGPLTRRMPAMELHWRLQFSGAAALRSQPRPLAAS